MNRTLRVAAWVAALLALLVGLGRAFAIRWYRIPDDDAYLNAAIAPSLHGGDWVLLWRLTAPAHGDLVMCPEPGHPERSVIGRVMADEGERIEIQGTHVTVDGRPYVTESRCLDSTFRVSDPQTGIELQLRCDMEVVAGRTHMRGNADGAIAPLAVTTTAGDRQFYLVSDDRQFPYDSREFGPVESESCTETIFFRLMSSDGLKDSEHRLSYIR